MHAMRTSAHSLRRRLTRGGPRPLAVAIVLSLVLHALGAVLIGRIPVPKNPPRVLEVSFVSQGAEPGKQEATPPSEPQPAQPPQPVQTAAVSTPRPSVSPPSPVSPSPAPTLPEVRFPALQQAARNPVRPSDVQAPPSFAAWQESRKSSFLPNRIPDGGGDPDGVASVDSRGKDRCVPDDLRAVDRLYLLFDSSGSMSSQLRAQALSCAQQYAEAAIDKGAVVVVGNFAAGAQFFPPTRNMTDVALAIRADVDARATVLPSMELNPFFDQDPNATSDLVILSDGYIPNARAALPWYRYFLELNPENRGYLYTLGTPGQPDVVDMLERIGFDVYVYRVL
ncbi:MAG: hypothetical protein R3F61_23980 [Myxococcota bacterium]